MALPDPPEFVMDADLLASSQSQNKFFSILKQCDNDRVRIYVVDQCIERICQDKKIDFDSLKRSLGDLKITVVNCENSSTKIGTLDKASADWTSVLETDYAHQEDIRHIITDKPDNFSKLDKISGLPNLKTWTLDEFKEELEPYQTKDPEIIETPVIVPPPIIKEDPEIPEEPHIPKDPGSIEQLVVKRPITKRPIILLVITLGIGFLAIAHLIKGSSNQPTIATELVVGDDISRGEEMLPLPPLSNESCKIERQSNEEIRSATEIFQDVYNQQNSETSDQNKETYKNTLDEFSEAIAKNNKNRIYDPELSIYQQNAYAHNKGDVLTIAVVVPFSEENRDGSTNHKSYCNRTVPILRGVAMAQEEINTGKGIHINDTIYYLNIVIANDKNGKSYKAKNIAQTIVKDKTILGIIGHNSSTATSAALEEYNKNLVVVTSTSTASELGKEIEKDKNNSKWLAWLPLQHMRRWFYRAVISDEMSSRNLAEYLKKIKKDKISIIYEKEDTYSEGYLKFFEDKDEEQKNFPPENILKKFEFDSQQKRVIDFKIQKEVSAKEVVEDSIDSGVQSILIFTQSQDTKDFVLEVMKENAERGYPLLILGGNSLYECDKLGENSEGLILSVPWFQGSNDKTKSFNEKASKKWKGDINWRTATSYDAVKVFYNAFSNLQNVSREGLADKMQQKRIDISPDETSGDPLTFDDNGERQDFTSGLVQVKKSNKTACNGYRFEKVD
jgi:ABC-type branched-subunit amino acid transport system substrate-binding protein